MLHKLAARMTTTITLTRAHLSKRRTDSEAGVTTVELVVITVGLLLLAGIVVAAITAFVNGKVAQIA